MTEGVGLAICWGVLITVITIGAYAWFVLRKFRQGRTS